MIESYHGLCAALALEPLRISHFLNDLGANRCYAFMSHSLFIAVKKSSCDLSSIPSTASSTSSEPGPSPPCLNSWPRSAPRPAAPSSASSPNDEGPLRHVEVNRDGIDQGARRDGRFLIVSILYDPDGTAGQGSRTNGSFPKGAGRLAEKSPAGYPPALRRPRQPPGQRRHQEEGTRRQLQEPRLLLGTGTTTTQTGLGTAPPRERGRLARMLSLGLPLSFPAMRQPAPPAGGNRMGPAEAEPWRRCRSIRVEEMGEAIPGFVRAGRPRSRGAFSHDVVTPTSQYCRSIRAPLVIEGAPSLFVPIRVHSWFVFISKTITAGCFSSV